MTNSQMVDVLTKIYKDVDNLAGRDLSVNKAYILDYIKIQLDSIKTGKKPTRSQLAEIRTFIDKYNRLYNHTGNTSWGCLYSLYGDIYTIINPQLLLNIPATFDVPDDLKAPLEKYGIITNRAASIFDNAIKWAESGENTVFVEYGDVTKHLKLNGRNVKATIYKPFPVGKQFVNSFYIDSVFRMLKAGKLEFITNKDKPIVIKNNGDIVGVVSTIIMR